MSWSKLDIANLAINILNKKSVNSFSNSGEFSDSMLRMFDVMYPKEISKGSWRFATKIQQLSVLVAAPILSDKWKYQLQIPSDYLAALRTYPRMPYQIYGDVIYANHNEVHLEYRFLPDPTLLPAYFVDYFALFLAQRYAHAVADSDRLSSELKAEAAEALMDALFVDSQSHPTPRIISNPLIDVRGYGAPDTYAYGSNQ